ncbi:TrbC/VirB2 family protein [Pontixanthobacter sp. CEM42]|uniref:TrbC/VirB2 family protein n=1 Tax=Pontixanthobacter sp. CEM42 TaxID=2792077 RepID=UPI001AE0D347|nr:TrbC/VirB2 family protein [Pontixanthobacter sp. CEM42]
MLSVLSATLFKTSRTNALQDAVDWLTSTLLGSVAIGLCVLAVAFVGFMLLSGRLAVREGLRVVLGCFLLLGAPTIAAALMGLRSSEPIQPPVMQAANEELGPRDELRPSDYNPYGGASLRDDR